MPFVTDHGAEQDTDPHAVSIAGDEVEARLAGRRGDRDTAAVIRRAFVWLIVALLVFLLAATLLLDGS